MEQTNQLIQEFLETCTAEQALVAAKVLIDHSTISLTDPGTADALQLLAVQLMERLPINSKRVAADLQMLVDLLTAQQLCKESVPSLAKEYALCLRQTQQLKEQEDRLQQQEAMLRNYRENPQNTEAMQELQTRNHRQEQSIRRLQKEAETASAEITQLRQEVAQLRANATQQEAPETAQQKIDGLEKTVYLLNKQYKEQLQRNIELREESARQRMQLKRLQENGIDPEELAKLKERLQRQEQTIRDYQKRVADM